MAALEGSGQPEMVQAAQRGSHGPFTIPRKPVAVTQTREEDDMMRTEPNKFGLRENTYTFDTLGKERTTTGLRELDDGVINEDAIWRPQWLRPGVLGSFTAVSVCFTAVLPAMMVYSQQHNGLVETRESLIYLWRFLPTAILTVVAALWARVELQAMRYMPWIDLRRGQADGKHDLDYTAMLSPEVLVKSLRRKHYLVFFVTLTSFLIKAEIVLAPGLFRLTPVLIPRPAAIQTLSSFNRTHPLPDEEASQSVDTQPYSLARAIHDFEMDYPFGVTKDLAYQTFGSAEGGSRGTVDAPLKATVEGFFADIKCLKLEDFEVLSITATDDWGSYDFEIDLQFDGCNYSIELSSILWEFEPYWTETWHVTQKFSPARPCQNLPQQFPPFMYWAVRTVTTGNTSIDVGNVSATLCSPTAWFSAVDVVDDGASPNVTVLPNQPSTPFDTDMWLLLSTIMPIPLSWGELSWWGEYHGPVEAEQKFNQTFINDTTNTNDMMYDAVNRIFRRLAPITGHHLLRYDQVAEAVGDVSPLTEQLTVSQRVCLSMFVIFVLITLFTGFALLRYRWYTRVWYRDPATILGSLLFLHSHPTLESRMLGSDSDKKKEVWSHCAFTPLVLRTHMQIVFTILVIGLIAALIATLRVSQSSNGLVTVPGEEHGYRYLLWTSLPSLVMLGVSLYMSSVDAALRGLATLRVLSTRPRSSRQLDLSMLDMLGVKAFLASFRHRTWTITVSLMVAISCGLLATFATLLFSIETVPDAMVMQLQQDSWFGDILANSETPWNETGFYRENRDTLSSIMTQKANASFTWPKHTFADLAFPAIEETKLLAQIGARNVSITVTMPAAKLAHDCAKLPEGTYKMTSKKHYTAELQGKTRGRYQTTNSIDLNRTFTCPDGKQFGQYSFVLATNDTPLTTSYFREILPSPENLYNQYSSDRCNYSMNSREGALEFLNNTLTRTYMWGKFNYEAHDFDYSTYWRCNFSWAQVTAEVNMFKGPDGGLKIDPTNPPRPDYTTMKPFDPPFVVPFLEEFGASTLGSVDLGTDYGFDMATGEEESGTVSKPQDPLDWEALGDAAQERTVIDATTYRFRVAMAQLASMENRLGVGEDSTTAPFPAEGLPALEATVRDMGRRRLVQDPVMTMVVVLILGLVVVIHVWFLLSRALRQAGLETVWLSMDAKGLAPAGSSSIAMVAGLLHDSNANEHMPADARGMSARELHGLLAGLRFRLGWFRREQSEHFTVGVVDDDEFVFLGTKKEMERGAYKDVPSSPPETGSESGRP